MKFPNLFIVGAMKAGTSSLHEYLNQHPQIFMARMKEPQYFAPHKTKYGMWGQGNPLPAPGMDWYMKLFDEANGAQYAGESSVSYTARHWVSGCERRIWEFNPDARIIYLMRDPVERAISHYWHFVAAGREDRKLFDAIRSRDDYIARSDYAYQIKPYFDRFGQERVHLLTIEELQQDSVRIFRDLFHWLEIDEDVAIDTSQKHNVRGSDLRQSRRYCRPLVNFMQGWRWQHWKQKLPSTLTSALEHVASRRVSQDPLELDAAHAYLRKRLLGRVGSLARLVGREFPGWKTLYDHSQPHEIETDHDSAMLTYTSHIDCR